MWNFKLASEVEKYIQDLKNLKMMHIFLSILKCTHMQDIQWVWMHTVEERCVMFNLSDSLLWCCLLNFEKVFVCKYVSF